MTGSYDIEVYNRKIKYKLHIDRNITILRGESGTGKSRLFGTYHYSQNTSLTNSLYFP